MKMSLNSTPSGERTHIVFFGSRNAGKSSVVNRFTGQDLAVVSPVKGTTTDPVMKAMELLPLGPVQIIDTPGIDDEGSLGELRVKKTKEILGRTDVAVLVVSASGEEPVNQPEMELLRLFQEHRIPCFTVLNKTDLYSDQEIKIKEEECRTAVRRVMEGFPDEHLVTVSALTGYGMTELKDRIATMIKPDSNRRLIGDLLQPDDTVVLVVPIDSAAPKGRLILPQQQTIRDVLDAGASALVVTEKGLKQALSSLSRKPALVVTDSQAFESVNRDTPEEIPLTSFSILFARYKGILETAARGAAALKTLRDGDRILISEGCTHHRQCDENGTVKMPKRIREFTGAQLVIETSSGRTFPEDLSSCRMVIHCGGCMLNEREMQTRYRRAGEQNIPITNYGIAIAYMHGIVERSVAMFPELASMESF